MEFKTEWSKVREILHTVYMGLWVLLIYGHWFAGLDIFFSLYLNKIKKREVQLYSQVTCNKTFTNDGEREILEAELELVKKDISKIKERRKEAFMINCLKVLQRRFPEVIHNTSSEG